MDILGKAKRVRIYVNEGDRAGHQSIDIAVLELLRRENASGATALRAIEGFSGAGQIRTTRIVDIEPKLPILIEWIDLPETVERILPHVKALVRHGLITVDDTEVVLHEPAPVRDVSSGLTAADIMTTEVETVSPDTPARHVAELLLGKAYRAVPVVDGERRPVGIITNSDLVSRGGLSVRMELLANLDTPAIHAVLERMASNHKTARDIMTPRPATVAASAPLTQVAETMTRRRLKRLPVVGEGGALAGTLSRVDLLRTVSGLSGSEEAEPGLAGLSGDMPLSRVMRRDVPAVHPETPLSEVMQAVVSTRLNRVLVVDSEQRVVGIITDAELLERVTPALHPSVLHTLMHRLPFSHPKPAEVEAEHHAHAHIAGDLMQANVATASADTPLRDAIALMLAGSRKVIAVVDGENRLLGLVDRADILRGLASPP